jgi:hypothetical protein
MSAVGMKKRATKGKSEHETHTAITTGGPQSRSINGLRKKNAVIANQLVVGKLRID